MSTYILYNDEFVPSNQGVVLPTNRAFKFGDGLFESLRMVNGKLNFATEHADRISAGMKALKMDGHNLLDDYFLKQKAAELQKKNKFGANIRFRLTIYREGEGLYTPHINKAGYLLEATPLEGASYELNKKGLIVNVFDEITKSINKLSNYKTTSALLYVMAGLHQKQHQLDEAILLNQNGFICETTASNIFIVYQNQIYTPALSEGCVGGVMRSVIIQLAKMHGMPLIEAQISPDVLLHADEVFVTNATTGVRWVMGYERKRYFNEVAKIFNGKLNDFI